MIIEADTIVEPRAMMILSQRHKNKNNIMIKYYLRYYDFTRKHTILSTHFLQMLQWCVRGGLGAIHFLHMVTIFSTSVYSLNKYKK